MKKLILLLAGICMVFPATAQKKNFTYKFYGFVRGDLFYNTPTIYHFNEGGNQAWLTIKAALAKGAKRYAFSA